MVSYLIMKRTDSKIKKGDILKITLFNITKRKKITKVIPFKENAIKIEFIDAEKEPDK